MSCAVLIATITIIFIYAYPIKFIIYLFFNTANYLWNMSQQKSSSKTGTGKSSLITFSKVKRGALLLRALNNPLRQKIFEFLETSDNATVTNIMIHVRERQTAISQQLGILRDAKIVSYLRKGKAKHYFINLDRVKEIESCLTSLLDEDAAKNKSDMDLSVQAL